jgi:predicted dehydrogenase
VVGCGHWGSKHARILATLPGVEVSLVDPDPSRRLALQTSYPVRRSVGELGEVVDELDAVVIATPPSTHHALGRAALAAGVHTLVEKPLTTEVADGMELVALADEQGLVLMVGHTFEFNPAVWGLVDAVRDPRFGRVRYVNSSRLNLGLYQPDVDVIWDLAPHDISIINLVLGSRPSAVSAWTLNLMTDRADVGYLLLRYDELDVGACVHVSWLDPMKVRRTTVVGESSMAVYDDLATEERLRIYDKGVRTSTTTAESSMHPLSYRYGDIVSPYIDFREPLWLELAHFVDCVRGGTRPRVDGQRGLDVVRVLRAADRARRSGGWVEVGYDGEPDPRDLVGDGRPPLGSTMSPAGPPDHRNGHGNGR